MRDLLHRFARRSILLLVVLGWWMTYVAFAAEPPGPSSRTGPIAITEIMYKPVPPQEEATHSLEFVELYNSNPFFEDLSGYHLEGDVQFTLPRGTILQGGAYLVIARDPEAIRRVYPISNVVGPFTGALKPTGLVQLLDKVNAVMLEVPYSNEPPWPVAADGTGHSMVLARPSYGEGYAEAWSISDHKGGSPGTEDRASFEPLQNLVINEFLANSSPTTSDYVELYNHGREPLDISGAWLSDAPNTNKFRIPKGTILPAGGFVAYTELQLGFSLSAQGETLYLVNPSGDRVLDAVKFGDQRPDVATGRVPDGNREWYPLKTRSPGSPNTEPLVSEIVINELMYSPISGDSDDSYVELFNQGTIPVDLGGWRLVSGMSFEFPPKSIIPPSGFVVVTRNKARLLSHYPGNLTPQNTFGDASGKLTGDGHRVALAMPIPHVTTDGNGVIRTNTIYPIIDETTFGLGGRWGDWANGGGSSLELRDPRSNHRLASNWGDSDETGKAPWTSLEATGIIDNSAPFDGTIRRLEVTLLNAGECLLDDVEVVTDTNLTNKVSNPGFEEGLAPWVVQGTHVQSRLESGEGYQSGKSLKIVATSRGDTGANRVRVPLTSALAPNQICTIRAKARWLRGWPELILRLSGNGHELAGTMNLPANLGTPGAPNSRSIQNAPPALSDVRHSPILPAANQAVVITARVNDPDGLQQLTLSYRLDPATTYTSVPMKDDGINGDIVAGDGVFSATIPGQPTGTLVAFYLEAKDAAKTQASARFPDDAPTRECLVRFGEASPVSGFGTYHFWMTEKNVKTWINRPSLSNERVEGTFVYGDFRVIYNMAGKYSGSPYHQGIESPASTNSGCNYSLEFPLDDMLLGTENFNKIHAPGNGPFDDETGQREQAAFWLMRQMDIPYNYRRFVAFYFNGNRKMLGRCAYMEDTQTPGADMVRQRFPKDKDGNLHKLQLWFEFDDVTVTGSGGAGFIPASGCTLLNFYTGPNKDIKKLARYRYNWLTRSANLTANDYTNVWDLTDAANTSTRGDYVANMKRLVDVEEWMRIFAVEHTVGNWDSFGNGSAQNMYAYKPTRGKWTLMTWDVNTILGNQGSDGPTGDDLFSFTTADTAMGRIYQTPEFRRMYLRALKELAAGPLNGNTLGSLLDAKYAALSAGGVPAADPAPIKSWISARQAYLASEVGKYSTNFSVFGSSSYSTNAEVIVLSGSAPLEVTRITVNGIDYPLSWIPPNNVIANVSYVTTWRISLPLAPGANSFTLAAFDRDGKPVAATLPTLTIQRTTEDEDPVGKVVINEIHYNPSVPNASFIELFNASSAHSFDLSGWRLDGLDYTFPPGSFINRGQYLVVAKDAVAVTRAFSTDVPVFGEYGGGLSDAGEVITLMKTSPVPHPDVIVDRVRYEPSLPWPIAADGLGSSLQLIDPSRSRARVSNWASAGDQVWIKATLSATNKSDRLLAYLTTAGDVYIDDISLIGPDGIDRVTNGGFEAPLTPSWNLGTNLAKSVVSTNVAHSGKSSLHLSSSIPFPITGNTNQALWQALPSVTPNRYTLTFWYLPSTSAVSLGVKTLSTPPFLLLRRLAPVYATPGTVNNVAGTLSEYDDVWLNEILPYNLSGRADHQGDKDPWVEIYNHGSQTVNLSNYSLTDDYSNLERWHFPTGTLLQPGEFLTVWLDGEPETTTSTELHADFSPPLSDGSIALVRSVEGAPQIVDYLNYSRLTADRSYGSFPEGQPFFRQRFNLPTPGSANDGTPAAVVINEWMASNTSTLPDPVDGKFHDWLELYNPDDTTADLSGFFLTDDPANRTQFTIPPGTILSPRGHLLVWADKLSSSNSAGSLDLHANFNLSKKGGDLLLISPSGVTVDQVFYSTQTNNISEGRFPDGEEIRRFMDTPTPRAANVSGSGINRPPRLAAIPNRIVDEGVRLQFTATATDDETPSSGLLFSLEPGAPLGATVLPDGRFRWRVTEDQGPGVYSLTLRVTDRGVPALSDTTTFSVEVIERNRPPVFDTRAHYGKVGQLLSFSTASDPDIPIQQLSFTLAPTPPQGLSIDPKSGVIRWVPLPGQTGSSQVTVRVSDNGVPPLSASYTYSLNVVDLESTLLVGAITQEGAAVRIQCQGTEGRHYQLFSSPSLSPAAWTPVGASVLATASPIAFLDPVASGESRYYRIEETP